MKDAQVIVQTMDPNSEESDLSWLDGSEDEESGEEQDSDEKIVPEEQEVTPRQLALRKMGAAVFSI
jgi:hypothetical protein